jgi:hypothetical protein
VSLDVGVVAIGGPRMRKFQVCLLEVLLVTAIVSALVSDEKVLGCYASTDQMLQDFSQHREELKEARKPTIELNGENNEPYLAKWKVASGRYKSGRVEFRLYFRREKCPTGNGLFQYIMTEYWPQNDVSIPGK